MKKHSYKEIERQRREDDIIAAAQKLIVERGYTNLTMDDLANFVGISKPTLYQHFKSKDELALKVLMYSYKAYGEYLFRPLEEPAIDRMIGLIRSSLGTHAPGSIVANLRNEMRSEVLWKMFREHGEVNKHKDAFFRQLYSLVDKGKEEGSIDAHIPTPVVAHLLLSLNRSLSDPNIRAEYGDDPNWVDSAIESVIRVFLHGVTPSSAAKIEQKKLETDKV